MNAMPDKFECPAHEACWFARYILKYRYPEGEQAILESPWWSATYAAWVIRGRWMEAEPIMLKDVGAAGYYWFVVRSSQSRWVGYEDLLTSGKGSPHDCATYVLNTPRAPAEKFHDRIREDSEQWRTYRKQMVDQRRWEVSWL